MFSQFLEYSFHRGNYFPSFSKWGLFFLLKLDLLTLHKGLLVVHTPTCFEIHKEGAADVATLQRSRLDDHFPNYF